MVEGLGCRVYGGRNRWRGDSYNKTSDDHGRGRGEDGLGLRFVGLIAGMRWGIGFMCFRAYKVKRAQG